MPSLVVSLAGKPQATHSIHRPCTRIGRAPGNDIVLAGSTVSGAHAVLVLAGTRLAIEDLESSNGTFVGGKRIARADLEDGSLVAIGNYTLKLVADRRAMAYEPTMLVRSADVGRRACLQRLDGPLRGEVLALTKVVSTIGTPGRCMVTIIRRGDDFAVRCGDATRAPRLNGAVLTDTPVRLDAGDILEMDSGHLQFLLQEANVPLQAPERAVATPAPPSWLRRATFRPAP